MIIFQSTLPQGEWLNTPRFFIFPFNISIHTPARGVTISDSVYRQLYRHFNPHSRKGSDSNFFSASSRVRFQSTLPQGEWQSTNRFCCFFNHFNPHSRKGSDWKHFWTSIRDYIFQSTLPQGEWRGSSGNQWKRRYISIHTPARGVTNIIGGIEKFLKQFQSTLPQGEWPMLFWNIQ